MARTKQNILNEKKDQSSKGLEALRSPINTRKRTEDQSVLKENTPVILPTVQPASSVGVEESITQQIRDNLFGHLAPPNSESDSEVRNLFCHV